MSDFIDSLKVKGKAEEDIYFAKRDRELIEALRNKRLRKVVQCEEDSEKEIAREYEKRFDKLATKHRKKPRKLLKACKNLVSEILEKCSARHK